MRYKALAQSQDGERATGLWVPPSSACCGDGGESGGRRAKADGKCDSVLWLLLALAAGACVSEVNGKSVQWPLC